MFTIIRTTRMKLEEIQSYNWYQQDGNFYLLVSLSNQRHTFYFKTRKEVETKINKLDKLLTVKEL